MLIKNKLEYQEYVTQKKGANVQLLPEYSFESEFISLQLTELPICTNFGSSELYNDDLWTSDGKSYFFTKLLLDKIAIAGGVKFTDSGLCCREVGEDKRVIYLKHKIKYEYRLSDSVLVSSVVTGEYSFEEDIRTIVYRDDVIVNLLVLHQKGEPLTDLIEKRRNSSGAVAEASAKRKALIEVFPRLKKPFTLEELKLPIIVGKIVFDKEYILKNNPEFKKAYLAKMLELGTFMYGLPSESENKLKI